MDALNGFGRSHFCILGCENSVVIVTRYLTPTPSATLNLPDAPRPTDILVQ
jgi:hypothetical protein